MRIPVLVTLLSFSSALAADPDHSFSIHDMLAMDRVGEPQVSPDGKLVVFSVRVTDLEENKGKKDLWLARTDGSEVRQLTTHPSDEHGPRWMPDGKTVFFVSSRSGSSQVWKIPVDGGEATKVTTLPLDLDGLILSPDGSSMAFGVEVFPDLVTLEDTKKKNDETEKKKATGRIHDQVFVRHWDQWADGRRNHLFVMPTTGQGQPVDVMKGMAADAPSRPFGDTEEYTFSPDGKELVFSARDAGTGEPWSTNFDLYRVPVDASKAPASFTAENKAWDTHPLFSPDGKTLAYFAMSRPGYESDRFRIMTLDWAPGATGGKELAKDWDSSPSELVWAADSRSLYATAQSVGQLAIFSIDAATGKALSILAEGHATAVGTMPGGILFCHDTLKAPAEIWTAKEDGSDLRRVTRINDEKIGRARMGDFEQFSFPGWNQEKVHGFAVKPVGFEEGKKFPVAFIIHGGPQGSSQNTFHYRWNAQAFAGAGYGVVMIDFHGSTGYGQAFTDSIQDDWGGKPLEDLKLGLAAALEKYPWLDAERVGALGASYGGFMINWIAGSWPDGFRCLVNHDGILDTRMGYLDTEELWFPEWEKKGTLWDNPQAFDKHNPINLIKEWKTPMLVVHGGKDFRVVETQGLATFNALQRKGIPSRLLYFPDENHWVLKPQNSILWHETVIAWLDRWLKK